jgi:hypothetical protein
VRARRGGALSLGLALLTGAPALPAAAQHRLFLDFSDTDQSGTTITDDDEATSGTLSGSLDTMDGQFGSAEVEFGRIGVFATGDWQEIEPPPSSFVGARSTAGWEDRLTVTAPGVPQFSTGYLSTRWDVSGGLSRTGNGEALWTLNVRLQGSSLPLMQQFSGFCFTSSLAVCQPQDLIGDDFGEHTTGLVQFQFGSPVVLTVSADASAGGQPTATGTAEADLGTTVRWEGFGEVLDEQMQPVVGFSVASSSGFAYELPEPAPAVSAAAACTALGALSRWRARRAGARSVTRPSTARA